jgi:hypothetical protein
MKKGEEEKSYQTKKTFTNFVEAVIQAIWITKLTTQQKSYLVFEQTLHVHF